VDLSDVTQTTRYLVCQFHFTIPQSEFSQKSDLAALTFTAVASKLEQLGNFARLTKREVSTMARLRTINAERASTTTRFYVDTVRILKILAEASDKTMADYLDDLVKEAARKDFDKIQAAIEAYTGRVESQQQKKKSGS